MIVLTDEQAITVHRLLTCILLNETYRLADVEDALVWLSPENWQKTCPYRRIGSILIISIHSMYLSTSL
jgi:hypothetical protein